jgi:hypothetical protein
MRMVLEFGIASVKDFLILLFIVILSVSINFASINVQQDFSRNYNGPLISSLFSSLYFNVWGYRNVTIIGDEIYDEYNMMNFDQYYIQYLTCTPYATSCTNNIFYISSFNNLVFIRVMLIIIYSLLFLILISLITKLYKAQFLILVVFLLLMVSIGLLMNDIRSLAYMICFTLLFIYLVHTTYNSKDNDKSSLPNIASNMELTT